MMKFIEFEKEKCDGCYKCLRVCPTKAISFNKSERKIVDALCIKCGLCEASCPQDALNIRSQLEEVFHWIAEGKKVSVTIAPSFVGAFGLTKPTAMASVLRQLGFIYVEETAIGADVIADHYDKVINDYMDMSQLTEATSFITSCCPSANYLIEEYYPSLIPYIIPVVSPMIAHGRMMKAQYGEDHKIVFIGPCLAKMAEAEEISGAIDAVITFEELDQMMKANKIHLNEQETSYFDCDSSIRGCAFPLGGSLREKEGNYREDHILRYIHVDGIENCIRILDELKRGILKQCVIELNSCTGSCINGPDMPHNKLQRYEREMYMRQYMNHKKISETDHVNDKADLCFVQKKQIDRLSIPISRQFSDKQLKQIEPNKKDIIHIMNKMGKYALHDELNCGACGYFTCHDKAKAVFHGYSDNETCLPYLRKKAESMQSIMIEHSPNVVCLIDNNLTIIEVNPSFMKLFNPQHLDVIGLPIEMFMDHGIFKKVIDTKQTEYNQKIFIQENNRYFIMNIIYLEENSRMIVFMTDISHEMKRQEEFSRVKEETLLKTQEVIDKQMRVAQEIASLLGETTAETKMSLLGLKKLVMNDRGVY